MKKLLFLLSLIAVMASCKKALSPEEQLATDVAKIKDYITAKNLKALATPESVYYVIDVEGTGTPPTPSNTIVANYKGYLLDGTVFDQSSTPFTSRLSGLIQGWQIGFQKFKKGGKGKLLIPSALGYGTSGQGSIPANSVLIFDVELIDVK